MASEQIPSPVTPPALPWFARLGTSGKLLALGGLAGIIAAFLPLASVSLELGGQQGGFNPFEALGGNSGVNLSVDKTVMVVEDWRGKVGIAAYLAAMVLAFVLYPPTALGQKGHCWAGVGVGLVVVVLAIWLLIVVFDSSSTNLMGMVGIKAKAGIGAFLNLLAGAAVAAGGFLKAREEKLI